MDPDANSLGKDLGNIDLDRSPAPDVALLHKSYQKQQELLLTLSQNLASITITLNAVKEEQARDKLLIQQQQDQLHKQASKLQSSTDQLKAKSEIILSAKSEPSLTHLRFLGRAEDLAYFLDTICDFIRQHDHQFANDARRINFISLHFKDGAKSSAADTWFSSLLRQNAVENDQDPTSWNLWGLPFVLAELRTLRNFCHALSTAFGDRQAKEKLEREFDSCKQGSKSISDFNSTFAALAAAVDISNASKIKKYVSALNTDLAGIAIMLPGWDVSTELREKMELTLIAARKQEELLQIKGKPTPYSMKTPSVPSPAPDAMDIDVIHSKRSPSLQPKPDSSTPLSEFRQECRKRGLCFNCLQSLNNNHSTVDGFRCPNNRLSLNFKMNWLRRQKAATSHTTVQSMEIIPDTPNPPNPSSTVASILSTDISSRGSRFIFNMEIQHKDRHYLGKVLLDTGATENFVDEHVIRDLQLSCKPIPSPRTCTGFNGHPSKIEQVWGGKVCISDLNHSTTFFDKFFVTRLHNYDMILGTMWMMAHGVTISFNPQGTIILRLGADGPESSFYLSPSAS